MSIVRKVWFAAAISVGAVIALGSLAPAKNDPAHIAYETKTDANYRANEAERTARQNTEAAKLPAISLRDAVRAYERNPANAKAKYLDLRFTTSAPVAEIADGLLGGYTLYVQADGSLLQVDFNGDMGTASVGDTIRLRCEGVARTMGMYLLKDCDLLV